MTGFTTTETPSIGFKKGDRLAITMADRRWWRRFWYWITFRKNPQRTVNYTITRTDTPSTVTLKK